jgi:transposase
MISMAQFHRIKWLHEREGLSERKIAIELGVSRNTVRKYLAAAESPTTMARQKSYGNRTYSDEVRRVLPIIDEWLKSDETVWKKQNHTAVRIHARLVKEYGFTGSASNIRAIVARRRNKLKEVFIPLEFQLGHQFQFDWGEADVTLRGRTRRVYLFCMQLSASRKRYVRAYLHERQEAFLDGFVQAFNYLGGVPAEGLFDNLKSAVVKILAGRDRVEQETFQALQAHYLFKAEFCNVRSGNEKGQVEGLVGYTRRNALVPVPDVQSLDDLNEHLIAWCEQSEQLDTVPHTDEKVADVWLREKEVLHPLPPQPFEACRLRSVTVSKTSTVTFETNQYSVPSAYVGHRVWLKAFVDHISVVAQNELVATHTRCNERGQLVLVLDHYLYVLLRKPRAIRDAAAMHSANIPEEIRAFQREMRRRHGADGDRSFVRFLLLHREVGMDTIQDVLVTAASTGVYHFEGLHDLLLKHTGQVVPTGMLSADQVPLDLTTYRVQKADITRFNELINGGSGR